MWNYSNIRPIEECFQMLVDQNIKYNKYTYKEGEDFISYTFYHFDKRIPVLFLLLDTVKKRIKMTTINWIVTKSGKKYQRSTEVEVYKYGMCYSSYKGRYFTLPNSWYYERPVIFLPSLARLKQDELIEFLQKKFGKTFVNRYRDRLDKFPYSLLNKLDKKSFERVRQFVSKSGSVNDPYTILYLGKSPEEYINFILTNDYLNLCNLLNKKVVVGLSPRRYRELHDKYTKELNNKRLSKVKNKRLRISKDLQFNIEGFHLIKDTHSLIREGQEQNHCVGGYSQKINKGKCAIYTTEIEGTRYTVELVKKDRGVMINQMMAKHNKSASNALLVKIQNLFDPTVKITFNSLP